MLVTFDLKEHHIVRIVATEDALLLITIATEHRCQTLWVEAKFDQRCIRLHHKLANIVMILD